MFTGPLFDISHLAGLQAFYMNNNQLSGDVGVFYVNTSRIMSLSFVDISNNELTGQLPPALFTDKSPMQSFAAASNCITGWLIFYTFLGVSSEVSC